MSQKQLFLRINPPPYYSEYNEMQRSNESVTIIVTATVAPGRLEEWEKVFGNYLKRTREEPGNLRFDICIDPANKHVFWAYAFYKNVEARNYHVK